MKIQTSFTVKLIGLCLAGVLLLSLAVAVAFHRAVEVGKENEKTLAKTRVAEVGKALSAEIFERYNDAQAFAANPALNPRTLNKAESTAILNQLTQLYKVYSLIVVVDKSGQYLSSNTMNWDSKPLKVSKIENANFAAEPWFKAVSRGEFTEDKERGYTGTHVSDPKVHPLVSEGYGKPFYGNTFSAPIFDKDGKINGYISAYADISWIADEIKSVADAEVESHGLKPQFSLVDSNGVLLWEWESAWNKSFSEVVEEDKALGTLNLAEAGVKGVKEFMKGNSGLEQFMNTRKKLMQWGAYGPVNSAKWPRPLNWGLMVRYDANEFFHVAKSLSLEFFQFVVGGILLVVLFSTLAARKLSKTLTKNALDLGQTVGSTATMSTELQQAAQSVAEASSEQAAAIQQSVSALAEIGSMITRTAEGTTKAHSEAKKVHSNSQTGLEVMKQLGQSMNDVQKASQELQKIADRIQEIETKTGVIHDIVFKTQLLSFNASIEAARAGLHGKGFAVVAQEVGNLAQLSGNAAKDIDELIRVSQSQVKEILVSIQSKIGHSTNVALTANKNFGEISQGIEEILSQSKSISDACAQQQAGIVESNEAMKQMDIASQRNNAAANQSLNSAQILKEESQRLLAIYEELNRFVSGKIESTQNKSKPGQHKNAPTKLHKTAFTVVERSAETPTVDTFPDADDPGFKNAA